LSSAYLFFELSRFDYSIKKQLSSPRKIYVIDNAFSILGGFSMSPDRGRLLENIVFIELKRRGREIFYFSGKRECDFIIKDGRRITGVIQVCYEMNDKNMEREFEGLFEAMETFQLDSGLILTNDQEDTRKAGDRTVTIKPVWKWLLENELRKNA
jgi:predicted AAA+ superfamily ATPase